MNGKGRYKHGWENIEKVEENLKLRYSILILYVLFLVFLATQHIPLYVKYYCPVELNIDCGIISLIMITIVIIGFIHFLIMFFVWV